MNIIDRFLNKITMYRVVLYSLTILVFYSLTLSAFNLISFKPFELLTLLFTLILTCFFSNVLFSKVFKAFPNTESSLITALILYFLLWPSYELANIKLFVVAGIIAMLSKYIISFRKKHIFNPAAFAAFALFFLNSGGIWWIATPLMFAPTLIFGLLIVRKIRKMTVFLTFLTVSFLFFFAQVFLKGSDFIEQSYLFFTSFPVIFFGAVMLVEPLTMPPTRLKQIFYAFLVGVMFSFQGETGPIIMTTELVLLIGNIFSFLISPPYRLDLRLISKLTLAKDTVEYSFEKPKNFRFSPGQYMEWTAPIFKTDSRGNRRYFTIASSPTEEFIKLGIRHNNPSSSFKTFLSKMQKGDFLFASQLMGDFILPKNLNLKLIFIAGGIGITPFRSIVKYMIDKNEKRDVVLFYSNKTIEEIAYKTLFDEASKKIGLATVYCLTEIDVIPSGFTGERGRITIKTLQKHAANLRERVFFLSGPISMVEAYKKMLREFGIPQKRIITDYFPGF